MKRRYPKDDKGWQLDGARFKQADTIAKKLATLIKQVVDNNLSELVFALTVKRLGRLGIEITKIYDLANGIFRGANNMLTKRNHKKNHKKDVRAP